MTAIYRHFRPFVVSTGTSDASRVGRSLYRTPFIDEHLYSRGFLRKVEQTGKVFGVKIPAREGAIVASLFSREGFAGKLRFQ